MSFRRLWRTVDKRQETNPTEKVSFKLNAVSLRQLMRFASLILLILIIFGESELGADSQLTVASEGSQRSGLASWAGTYLYTSSGGKTVSDTAVVVRYQLAISLKTTDQ